MHSWHRYIYPRRNSCRNSCRLTIDLLLRVLNSKALLDLINLVQLGLVHGIDTLVLKIPLKLPLLQIFFLINCSADWAGEG